MKLMKPIARFFQYLNPADGPVIEGLQHREVTYTKHQPEYNPLRTLRANTQDGRVLSRWTLTEEQRRAVATGADIYLELMTFQQPLQPIRLAVGLNPNEEFFEGEYCLDGYGDCQASATRGDLGKARL